MLTTDPLQHQQQQSQRRQFGLDIAYVREV